jgi:hypothetical protein
VEETSNRFATELLLKFLPQMVDGRLKRAIHVIARDRAVEKI